jgi:AraC-like DNA-binding protein
MSCFRDWKPASPTDHARARHWFSLLLLDFAEAGFAANAFMVARHGPVPDWIQKLADQLNRMAARPDYNTTALYRSSGYHRNHVTKAFQEYFGGTPAGMLTRHRLELAIERLTSNPEMSLAEVAFASGYSSQAVFNRQFLRLTGKTPGQFRRSGGNVYTSIHVRTSSASSHPSGSSGQYLSARTPTPRPAGCAGSFQ